MTDKMVQKRELAVHWYSVVTFLDANIITSSKLFDWVLQTRELAFLQSFEGALSVGQAALENCKELELSVRRGLPKKALNLVFIYVFVRLFLPPFAVSCVSAQRCSSLVLQFRSNLATARFSSSAYSYSWFCSSLVLW